MAQGIQEELDNEIRKLERHLAYWKAKAAQFDPVTQRDWQGTAANLVEPIEDEIGNRKGAKQIFAGAWSALEACDLRGLGCILRH